MYSALLTSYLIVSEKLVCLSALFRCAIICEGEVFEFSALDPVTRGLSIIVNWLGIQVDVSNSLMIYIMD